MLKIRIFSETNIPVLYLIRYASFILSAGMCQQANIQFVGRKIMIHSGLEPLATFGLQV